MNKEIWRDIKGFEGYYQVSNWGRVRSCDRTIVRSNGIVQSFKGRILKLADNRQGYKVVNLAVKGKVKMYTVHRLVATNFLPNPKNLPVVNHRNGRKECNAVDNLEWNSSSDNNIHAYRTGLKAIKKGEDANSAKLTMAQVRKIRKEYIPRHNEFGAIALAKKYQVDKRTISCIVCNRTYKE